MKNLSKFFFLIAIFWTLLTPGRLAAQPFESPEYAPGPVEIVAHGANLNWYEIINYYGIHEFWWVDPDGNWTHTEFYSPEPWPPEFIVLSDPQEDPQWDPHDDPHVSGHIDDDDDFPWDNDDNWWPTDQDLDGDWVDDMWADLWQDYWDYYGGGPSTGTGCLGLEILAEEKAKEENRKKYGIGEVFSISVKNYISSLGCATYTSGGVLASTIDWSVENVTDPLTGQKPECKISGSPQDNFAWFDAGFKPGKVIIRAKLNNLKQNCANCDTNLEMEIEILEPKGVVFEYRYDCMDNPNYVANTPMHVNDKISMFYKADYYLLPDDVNFYNVITRELEVEADCPGLYWNQLVDPDEYCPKGHGPSEFNEMSRDWKLGKGTKGAERDNIGQVWFCNKDLSASLPGEQVFNIPWEYQRRKPVGVEWIPITTVEMRGVNVGGTNSQFTLLKNNLSMSNRLKDLTSCTPATCD